MDFLEESDAMYRRPNRFRFLYFVRHGQYRRTDAHPDGELTEKGVEQAKLRARHFFDRGVEFDIAWTSTMHRAEQTANVIIEEAYPDLALEQSPLLREKIFPCANMPQDLPDERKGNEALIDEIFERFMRPSRSERHELITCHGNLIRAILTRTIGAPLEVWPNMHPCHCGVTTIVCFEHEQYRLLNFNDHTFLPPNLATLG